jgi:hypothetical protein
MDADAKIRTSKLSSMRPSRILEPRSYRKVIQRVYLSDTGAWTMQSATMQKMIDRVEERSI